MWEQQKQSNDPRNNQHNPQYANYWVPLTRRRHTMPQPAQPWHTNYWALRTRKQHQQEHRLQRPTECSDPTQHAKEERVTVQVPVKRQPPDGMSQECHTGGGALVDDPRDGVGTQDVPGSPEGTPHHFRPQSRGGLHLRGRLVQRQHCPRQRATPTTRGHSPNVRVKSECSPPNEGVRLHLGKVMLFRTSDRDRQGCIGRERNPKGGGGQKRLDRRLQEVAGGYYRLQMPLRPALTVRGTVAGRRLGALEGGGGNPPLPMHPCLTPNSKAVGGGCHSGWGRLLSVAMPLKLALAVRGTVAAPLSKTSATLCSKHSAAAARPGVASDSFPRLHMP